MIDIVVFAILAVFLFARLWALFGQKNEDEPETPNPFARREAESQDEGFIVRPMAAVPPPAEAPSLLLPGAAPPESLAGGIESVKRQDPSFEEKKFLQGARAAFARIVGDFARGDLSAVERFLAPVVLDGFREAIRLRQEKKETLETEIRDIVSADMVAARVEGQKIFVSVEFISRQTNATRGPDGAVISGSPDQVVEVRDTWTFARDAASADPNWLLIGTKS